MRYLGRNNIINPTKWVWTGLSFVLRVIGWDGWRFSYFTGFLILMHTARNANIYYLIIFVFLVLCSTDLSKKQHYKWLKCFLFSKCTSFIQKYEKLYLNKKLWWKPTLFPDNIHYLLHHHNYFTTIKISVILKK